MQFAQEKRRETFDRNEIFGNRGDSGKMGQRRSPHLFDQEKISMKSNDIQSCLTYVHCFSKPTVTD